MSISPHFLGSASVPHLPVGAACRVPAQINTRLRPYQREGVAFMHAALHARGGALLCDDMGLGKTIQIIALLSALLHKTSATEELAWQDSFYERHAAGEASSSSSSASSASSLSALRQQAQVPARKMPTPLQRRATRPVLLLAPSSLLSQWRAELAAWSEHLEHPFIVLIAHGERRAEAIQDTGAGKAEVVLTTYQTYARFAAEFDTVPWRLLVCDEVHLVKNPKSMLAGAVRKLALRIHASNVSRDFTASSHAAGNLSLSSDISSSSAAAASVAADVTARMCVGCIGLTGTPVQNNLEELWCTVDCVLPGVLGDLNVFKAHFEKPIKVSRAADATADAQRVGLERMQQLAALIRIVREHAFFFYCFMHLFPFCFSVAD